MKRLFRGKDEAPESPTAKGLPKEPPKIYSTISAGDIDTVKKYLAKKELDPNTTEGHDEDTALIWAAYCGQPEIAKLLVEDERVDVNKTNFEGNTPLFYAAARNRAQCIEELLKSENIDVNKTGTGKRTALMIGLENGAAESVEILLNDERVQYTQKSLERIASRAMYKAVLASDRISPEEAVELFNNNHNNKEFAIEVACQKGLSPGEFIKDEKMLEEVLVAVAERNRSHQKSAKK